MVVCPWRFFGDPRGDQGGVRCGEHEADGWGMARGPSGPWFEAIVEWVRFKALVCQHKYRCLDEAEAFGPSGIKFAYAV